MVHYRTMDTSGATRALLLALVLVGLTVPASPAEDKVDIHELLSRAVEAYSQVSDYTCLFDRTELVADRLVVEKNTIFRFKKPGSIYLRIMEGKNRGVVSVYVEGENDGRMVVRPRGALGFVTIKLDPEGRRAMENSRHPIRDAGIGHVLRLIQTNYDTWRSSGLGTITYLGEDDLTGKRAHVVKAVFPEGVGYYGHVIHIHFDSQSFLPVKITIVDWKDRLVEEYQFRDVVINPGLTDEDFKPDRS